MAALRKSQLGWLTMVPLCANGAAPPIVCPDGWPAAVSEIDWCRRISYGGAPVA